MLSILLASLFTAATAIPTLSIKGAKFFTSDGDQFYIKGVAYQLTPQDPLADGDQCALDASLMKTLGANTIRVYHVDPAADHSSCMNTFADAGIYVFIDLDTFSTYILPNTHVPTWSKDQYTAYSQVVDAFHQYDNVAGFFVGNEVLNTGTDSIAAPYVKAAARDMKAYIGNKGYRTIPVGYSASDIPDLRPNLQNYLACGKQEEAIDFYSLNAYEWCGDSTYDTSGYSGLQAMSEGYNIPIFFSETGCITVRPRTFGDQAAIFGPEMSDTWSGSIIYEWLWEENVYGLIAYSANVVATASVAAGAFSVSGTPTPVVPDFDNLSKQWATLSPSAVRKDAYSPSLKAPACPDFTPVVWQVSGDVPLPTVGQAFNGPPSGSATPSDSGASPSSERPSTSAVHSSTSSPSSSSPISSSGSSSGSSSSSMSPSMPTTSSSSAPSPSPPPSTSSDSVSDTQISPPISSSPSTDTVTNVSPPDSSGNSSSDSPDSTTPASSGNEADNGSTPTPTVNKAPGSSLAGSWSSTGVLLPAWVGMMALVMGLAVGL